MQAPQMCGSPGVPGRLLLARRLLQTWLCTQGAKNTRCNDSRCKYNVATKSAFTPNNWNLLHLYFPLQWISCLGVTLSTHVGKCWGWIKNIKRLGCLFTGLNIFNPLKSIFKVLNSNVKRFYLAFWWLCLLW